MMRYALYPTESAENRELQRGASFSQKARLSRDIMFILDSLMGLPKKGTVVFS